MNGRLLVLATCVCVLAAGSAHGAAGQGVNLLRNVSFSACANPGFPDSWTGQSGWRTATHEVSDEGAFPGMKSVVLSNADGRPVVLRTGNVGWSPGATGTVYTFSVYMRSEPAGAVVSLGGNRFEGAESVVGSAWKRYAVTSPLKAASGYGARFLSVETVLTPKVKARVWVSSPSLVRESMPAASSGASKAASADDDLGPIPSAKIALLSGERPKIDGVVDDACWKGATALKDFVLSSKPPKGPPANRTEAFLLRSANVLYVGAKCYDADMKRLSKKDWFEIFFSDPDLLVYYHFWLHPSGDRFADGTPGIFLFEKPLWTGKVSLQADCWQVEMAIPFYNLSPERLSGDMWRFNVCREKYSAPQENSQWSNTGGYFHVPHRFGMLHGMGGVDFTPSVEIAREISEEDISGYAVPDHMLLDRSYYTREDEARVMVRLAAASLGRIGPGSVLRVTVKDAAGTTVSEQRTPCGRSPRIFSSFGIAGLAVGEYAVEGLVETDGRAVARFVQTLKKLPPHPNEVKVNRFTRLFRVNGKPFIPLICDVMFWGKKLTGHDTPADGLETVVRESGFNVFCLWGNHSKVNIDECARLGMKIIPMPQVSWQKTGKDLTDALAAVYREYRDYPNIFGWFTADEGNIGGSEAEFIERVGVLRGVDPYHPIFRNDGGWVIGSGGPGGLETTDIFLGGYGGHRLADSINVDAVPRGMPSLTLAGLWAGDEIAHFPTPAETVSWIYQCLVHGACGGFWWGTHDARPPVPAVRDAFTRIRKEIDFLTPVFDTIPCETGARADNERVHFTLRELGGVFHLVCVNVSKEPQTAVFTFDRSVLPARGRAEVLFDGGSVSYRDSMLKASFAPLERRVYRMPGLRSPGGGR